MKRIHSILALALILAWGCRGVAPKIPKMSLDPESEKFYETARLIMSKEEMKIFAGLPDAASRKDFIADFWAKRDPDPFTPVNEFKQEFLRRVDYANKRFKEGGRGVNTDRGRVYLFLGPPDKFEEFQTSGDPEISGPVLHWIYYSYELVIVFADERGDGRFRIQKTEGDFFGAMEWIKLGQVAVRDEKNKAKFTDFNLTYDPDKKEILVKFPLKAIRFRENGGGALVVLNMAFYIYETSGKKVDLFQRSQQVTKPDSTEAKAVTIHIPYDLKPGDYYIDAVIIGQDDTLAKTRKIFEIKF